MSGIVVSSTPDDDGTTQFEAWEEITSDMRDAARVDRNGLTHHETRIIDGREYGRVGSRHYGPPMNEEDRAGRYQRRQDEYDEAYALIRDHVSYIDGLDPTCAKGCMVVRTADIP